MKKTILTLALLATAATTAHANYGWTPHQASTTIHYLVDDCGILERVKRGVYGLYDWSQEL